MMCETTRATKAQGAANASQRRCAQPDRRRVCPLRPVDPAPRARKATAHVLPFVAPDHESRTLVAVRSGVAAALASAPPTR